MVIFLRPRSFFVYGTSETCIASTRSFWKASVFLKLVVGEWKWGRWRIVNFNSEDVKWKPGDRSTIYIYICYNICTSYNHIHIIEIIIVSFWSSCFDWPSGIFLGFIPRKCVCQTSQFFVYHHKFHSNPAIIPLYSKPGNPEKWIEFSL